MKTLVVSAQNVRDLGFFCKMSQRSNPGYERKLAWLERRFAEGLFIRLLDLSQGGRGFIEYLPGEYAWRPVKAAGYMFIHCLWVVGSSKGKGYASRLLHDCIADAKRRRMKGVAMLARKGNWLLSPGFLLHHGFENAAVADPDFQLMVLQFGKVSLPSMPSDWEARARRFGAGLTIVRSDQCPYLDDGVNHALKVARARGLKTRVVELASAAEVRRRAPSPYGVFSLVLDGRVLSHHYRLENELRALLDARGR
jgi:GNAT superfamily N-acetyltransferase